MEAHSCLIERWQSVFEIPLTLDENGAFKMGEVYICASDCNSIAELLDSVQDQSQWHDVFLNLMHRSHEELLTLMHHLCFLKIAVTHSLIQLVAQALVKQYRESGEYAPDAPEKFIALFNEFENKFPLVAPSLKMYVYLDLSKGERIILNSYLERHISVSDFMEQNPLLDSLQDKSSDLFLCSDFLSYLSPLRFGELNHLSRERISSSLQDLRQEGYDLFLQEFIRRGCELPRRHLSEEIQSAFFNRSTVFVQYLIEEGALNPNTIFMDHPSSGGMRLLFMAVLFCDENMVKLLLYYGADPFSLNDVDSLMLSFDYPRTVIERVMNLYPEIENEGEKKVFKRICSLIVRGAYEYNHVKLFKLMRDDPAFCSKVLEVNESDELISHFNAWRTQSGMVPFYYGA
ncbi:MAG: hypothetical protein US32_C0030G0006 [candidate division TM6 bacterium GW2011_GWA2_36_9]|nr:MAG: hypothetical protein US32_C0030G0006 [candidate division TM6 bacterium GW2011_GWA2_36_9]